MSETRDTGTGPRDEKGKQKDSDVQQQEEEEKKQDVSERGNPHSSNPSGVPSRAQDSYLPVKKRTSGLWHRQMTGDQGHDQTSTAIDVKSESKTGQSSDAKKQRGKRSTRTGTRVGQSWREVFLYEMQLQPEDIGHSRLTIPWETAGNHFPPPTQSYKSESILVSDTQNTNWPMTVLNNTRTNAYLVISGWKEFATAHDLEARDVISFFRPVLPLQNYHYLVKYVKASGSYGTRLAKRKFDGKEGDHGGSSSPIGSQKAKDVVISEKLIKIEQGSPKQGHQGSNSPIGSQKPSKMEHGSPKQGHHGGSGSPIGSHKAKGIVISEKPIKIEQGSPKQGHHGGSGSPAGSRKAKGIVIGSERPNKIKLDIKIEGFDLEYLFKKKITHNDVTHKMLQIPSEKAEKHFPPLKKPGGSYKEELLLVSDNKNNRWWMKLKFSLIGEAYVISGSWKEYVAAQDLQADDVVRFFKVVKPVPDKHYYIDYVRPKEAGKGKGKEKEKEKEKGKGHQQGL